MELHKLRAHRQRLGRIVPKYVGISPSVEPISNGHQRLVLSVVHAVHGQDTGFLVPFGPGLLPAVPAANQQEQKDQKDGKNMDRSFFHINTKKLVVNPDEAANIRLMFEMYAQPTTSYGDITWYFAEQGILFNGKELIRPTLAQMLRNPVYVQADLDVYEFFKSQGTVIVNDTADFTGMNGCYLYQGRDVKPSKKNDLKDQMLVLAPHEGIVPADIWLACRKKLMNNMKIQSARKATHTWLAGKIKCGNCGYALMSIFNPSGKQYLRCTKRLDNKSCPGCGKIITSELETVVYQQMVKKLAS